ncbi:hypothetical protein [Microbulbifer elongatus]|uniref:hypothetical protein n=1 Tax=Microbulbifer elongatus TaxID=86173 RepID=UPI001E534F53|nr:hypothetical protein [Microbulbifer elongatus]
MTIHKLPRGALLAAALFLLVGMKAQAESCPASHPLACGGACYTDAAQAASGGCAVDGGSSGSLSSSSSSSGASSSGSSSGGSAQTCHSDENPSHVVSGRRAEFTQDWCDTVCVTYVGNGTGCLNAAGTFVSNASICSDPANAREAIIDIEYNLGIEIDDEFQALAGYQGPVPSINPTMTVADAKTYFSALIGPQKGNELVDLLNTNGDGIVTRNEASMAKGSDPLQLLNTDFGCGLSTDDIMAYVGLYMGDGAIDKYAGDLDESVKASMLEFTRSWQPGVSAQDCEYRGGCDGSGSQPQPAPEPEPQPEPQPVPEPNPEPSDNCPASHPLFSAACGQCFTDEAQAASAQCAL